MMYGHGFGMGAAPVMFLFGALRFAFWFAVIVGGAWLLYRFWHDKAAQRWSEQTGGAVRYHHAGIAAPRSGSSALDIAAERLARSEITPDEYREIVSALHGVKPPVGAPTEQRVQADPPIAPLG